MARKSKGTFINDCFASIVVHMVAFVNLLLKKMVVMVVEHLMETRSLASTVTIFIGKSIIKSKIKTHVYKECKCFESLQ